MLARQAVFQQRVKRAGETVNPSGRNHPGLGTVQPVTVGGFQADDQMTGANRFTGNAVKFLSVARFQTK